MKMKTCPACDEDVPVAASRCKHCFHDFNEVVVKTNGLLPIMAGLAAMATIGAGTLYWIISTPVEQKILMDQATESVIWTTKYRGDKVTTERLNWSNIGKLEYIITSSGQHTIEAVTITGDRKVIEQDTGPLKTTAEKYAALTQKPLEIIDNTIGFKKLAEEADKQ
jgi:hypothetical protein